MSKKSRKHNSPDLNFVPEDIISYKAVNFLDVIRSADDILNRIRFDSISVYKTIRNGSPKVKGIFLVDKECLCDLGRGKRPYVNRYYCVGCEMFRRMCSSVKIPDNNIIKVEVGKYEGKKLKFYEYETDFGDYTENKELMFTLNRFGTMENQLNLLDTSFCNMYKKTKVLSTDSLLTNFITVSILINNKMQKYKLSNTIPFEWSYTCNQKTFIIESLTSTFTEISNEIEFQKSTKSPTAKTKVNSLNPNMVSGILKQLIVVLHFLNKYSFIHGHPSINFLTFSKKPYLVKYNDITINCPVTLHLKPSFLTSMSYEDDNGQQIRLVGKKHCVYQEIINTYPVENLDVTLSYNPRNVHIDNDIPMIENLNSHIIQCYKIGNQSYNFNNYMNKYGMPLLHSSYEFYCFLVALLCEDNFYDTFMEDENLRSIWYSLWKISEYESMMDELIRLKGNESPNNEEIINFVSKYTLRVDALKHFYECIDMF